MTEYDILISNIDKIHTTQMGYERISKNLSLEKNSVISYCKDMITNKNSIITRRGKNWYIACSDAVITINAYSYTIITAHKKKND